MKKILIRKSVFTGAALVLLTLVGCEESDERADPPSLPSALPPGASTTPAAVSFAGSPAPATVPSKMVQSAGTSAPSPSSRAAELCAAPHGNGTMGGRDQFDGSVLDCEMGARLWQKATGSALNWNSAKQYCDSLSLVGVSWRLPTLTELRLLSGATGRPNLWVEAPFIEDTHPAAYWSSSVDTSDASKRLVWDYSGTTKWSGEDPISQHYVRCVSGAVAAGN